MKTLIKQYEINGVLRFTEEDIYNDGCQPKSGQSDFIKCHLKADSVEELIKKLFAGYQMTSVSTKIKRLKAKLS